MCTQVQPTLILLATVGKGRAESNQTPIKSVPLQCLVNLEALKKL